MLLVLSRILSRSSCILILIMSNIAISAPVRPRKRSVNENERGFSASPKILEIQLPLKITSKEDLLAWSKYVMNLVTSKITSNNLRNTQSDKQLPFTDNSNVKSKEMMMMMMTKKGSPDEKRQGLNYPAHRLKEPPVESRPPKGDDKVVAYPLPLGEMKVTNPMQDPFGLPTPGISDPTDFGQYVNFGDPALASFGIPFQQGEIDIFGNPEIFLQPPAAAYLPLPLTGINIAAYENAIDKNASVFEEPAKLQTTKNAFNFHIKPFDNELGGQLSPLAINSGLSGKNSSVDGALLTFPFQALVTIMRQPATAAAVNPNTRPKNHLTKTRNKELDKFLPFSEKNNTLTNASRQIDVILNNFTANMRKNKTKEENRREEQKKERKEQNAREKKKKSEKKTKTTRKKQQSSIKRQASVLGDLLRMLGILRKLPKNSTEISVTSPVLSILKGTNSQKIQVAFEDELPNRGRRNETFLAQQLNGDDDDDGGGNGDDNGDGDSDGDDNGDDNGNGDGDGDDDDDEQSENQEDEDEEEEDEEEEGGGSVDALLELLPLAAPILEDLSDPESDIDIAEVLEGALPLLADFSNPDEEGGFDIPSILVPLSQRLSEGPEGEGSDSGAILGPLIQLIAPLIGPLSGPLIGPLSRTSSGPGGKEGSASLITSLTGPLSAPQDAYGQSIISSLVASISAKLSQELSASAGNSDIKPLVSSLVQGVLAGASAGSSGPDKSSSYGPQKPDAYYAPTTYGDYGKPPSPGIGDMLKQSLQEILGAVLKLSAASSSSSASLSGASSTSSASLSTSSSDSKEPPKPTYGAPANPPYSPPYSPPLKPPAADSPYASFVRRQIRHQIRKLI